MKKLAYWVSGIALILTASIAAAAPARIDTLSCSATSTSSVGCSWTKPAPAAGQTALTAYECRRSAVSITTLNWSTRTPITPMPAAGPTGPANPTLSVGGLAPSTKVYVGCKAQDSTGWSILSNVVDVTTFATGGLPSASACTSVAATVYHDQLDVTWCTASGTPTVNGYKVYRSLTQNGTYTLVATLGNALTTRVTGLAADTEFWFSVAAVNANGEGPRSTPAMGKTVRSVRDVGLTWNPVSGQAPEIQAALADYVVYWGQEPRYMTGAGNAGLGTTYNVPSLDRYSPWYFCVDAFYGSYGHSTCSNYAMITPPDGSQLLLESVEHAPSGLATTTANTGTTTRDVTFSWTAPTGVSGLLGYKLLLGDGEARVHTVVSIPVGTTTHTVSGVLRTARLDATVVALYAWGESRPANPVVSWKTE